MCSHIIILAVACICMRDPSRFLRYPYGPSGLLLVWTTLSSIRRCTIGTSQVQDRGESAWVVGAGVLLRLTGDIWFGFIFYVGVVLLTQVFYEFCISHRMSCLSHMCF